MTQILPMMEKKVCEVLESIKTIVTVYQKDFWEKKEYILYKKAKDLDVTKLTDLLY